MFATTVHVNDLYSWGLAAAPVVGTFSLQYIALLVRDTRAVPRDPHLGRKAVCYLFLNLGIYIALIGLTVSALDWCEFLFEPAVQAQQARLNGIPPPPALDPTTGLPFPPGTRDWFNESQRSAAGLVVTGMIYAVLFWAIIRFFTNTQLFPGVSRTFAAQRFVISGLVTMITSTATMVTVFQRGEPDLKTIQTMCALAGVWGPVAAVHLVFLLWSFRRARYAES